MADFLIEALHLQKSYPTPDQGELRVLRDVSFGISTGEFVAVVGESGTGKSTLLHILGTLDRPTGGNVLFKGSDIFDHGDQELALLRNRSIGFVFQFHHLLPEFTALENVAMPALIRGDRIGAVRERATHLLDILGLVERRNQRPSQLSGGEQQRVAVARALMNEPALVLADEPTGNLDLRTAGVLHEELIRLAKELGKTFVVATHNPALAALADRVLRLENGTISDRSE
ncbi:MAG TPA: ABC transporter ATP-binding protein [Rhodothermales bacterium]